MTDPKKKKLKNGEGVAIGIALGLMYGLLISNIGLGLSLGAVIGTLSEWWQRRTRA